jgi:hypothetical protein
VIGTALMRPARTFGDRAALVFQATLALLSGLAAGAEAPRPASAHASRHGRAI